jgi:hypothetical protein
LLFLLLPVLLLVLNDSRSLEKLVNNKGDDFSGLTFLFHGVTNRQRLPDTGLTSSG